MTEKHIEDSSAPLIEHLTELRGRLIRSIIAFLIMMMVCFAFAEQIFEFLAQPLKDAMIDREMDPTLIFTGAHKVFFTYISISLFGGFFFAFPIIANQLWRFVAPGLYKSEQKALLPFLVASPLLFVIGAAFAYFAAIPLALDFFLGFAKQAGEGSTGISIELLPAVDEYLGLAMKFILAFGICFQLPVALTLMGKAGLVSSQALIDYRKYAVVGLLVVAALFTPPDVFSMLLLFVVIFSLYEISIWLVKSVEKKREEKLRAEGYYDDDFEEDEDFDEEEAPEGGAEGGAGAGPETTR